MCLYEREREKERERGRKRERESVCVCSHYLNVCLYERERERERERMCSHHLRVFEEAVSVCMRKRECVHTIFVCLMRL